MPFPQTMQRPVVCRLLITLFIFPAFAASTAASPPGTFDGQELTLAASPSSLDFGNIQVGGGGTQSQTLTNSGSSTVTIFQAAITGEGFGLSGLSLPVSLGEGESVTFSVTFTPKVGGGTSGTIDVVSNAVNPNLAVALSARRFGWAVDVQRGRTGLWQRGRGHEQGHHRDAERRRIERDHHVGDFHQCRVPAGRVVPAHDSRRRAERPGFADLHTTKQRCRVRQHFPHQQRCEYADGRDLSGSGTAATSSHTVSLSWTPVLRRWRDITYIGAKSRADPMRRSIRN